MKRLLLSGVIAALVLALPASGSTYYLLGPKWASGKSLVLKVDSSSVTDSRLQQAITAAEANWSLSPNVDMISGQGKVTVEVADGICPRGALACSPYAARNGKFQSVTVVVPPGVLASNGQHVLNVIACHELGHALGLDHQPTQDTCLYSSISTTYPAEVPNALDYEELAFLYGG